MYSEQSIIFFISSISNILANKNNDYIINVDSFRKNREFIPSNSIIAIRFLPFLSFIFFPISFFRLFYCFIFRHDSFKLTNAGIDFSNCFIDSICIKCGVQWRDNLNFFSFKTIFVELSYFLFLPKLFITLGSRISYFVSGDTSYRYSIFFECAKKLNLPIITNINLNSFVFDIFRSDDFDSKCTYTLTDNQSKIIDSLNYEKDIKAYFDHRFSGKINQHDVIMASKNKNRFTFDPNGKTVVCVFAHVFCDAPHNVPGMIFNDFYEWFLVTLEQLSKTDCFILVKEHPSASLYSNEYGLVKKIIADNFPDLNYVLVSDYLTYDVLCHSDFVVTCSGTVALEALFLKKQVILASDVYFNMQGITHYSYSVIEYKKLIENLDKPSFKEITFNDYNYSLVLKMCYLYFLFYCNNDYFPIPLPQFVRGETHKLKMSDFAQLELFMRSGHFSVIFEKFIHSDVRKFNRYI